MCTCERRQRSSFPPRHMRALASNSAAMTDITSKLAYRDAPRRDHRQIKTLWHNVNSPESEGRLSYSPCLPSVFTATVWPAARTASSYNICFHLYKHITSWVVWLLDLVEIVIDNQGDSKNSLHYISKKIYLQLLGLPSFYINKLPKSKGCS